MVRNLVALSAPLGLLLIVGGVLAATRRGRLQRLMRRLPTPLWCYLVPMLAVAAGWLPAADPWYRLLTVQLLPFALALLLLGVPLPSVWKAGPPALAAMALGAASIIIGAPIIAWLLRGALPADAWTGVGALAGTWTGGSMNLLALREALGTPDSTFTALILVDAVVAYSWMMLLVAVSSRAPAIDRWLRMEPVVLSQPTLPAGASPARRRRLMLAGVLMSAALAAACMRIAPWLPTSGVIRSADGWTIVLVTTLALALSGQATIRAAGECAAPAGTFGLSLVLAAMGAQARLMALWSAPAWLLLGIGVAVVHGVVMLVGGRLLRLPFGILATASQANFGGVVSAPLVAGVYDQALVPIGLCLAIAGNALGTYAGLLSAGLARWMSGGP